MREVHSQAPWLRLLDASRLPTAEHCFLTKSAIFLFSNYNQKLLRALQEKQFERLVVAGRTYEVDVRVIAGDEPGPLAHGTRTDVPCWIFTIA